MDQSYMTVPGVILPFLIGTAGCSDYTRRAPEKPNILVIMTDQQSASMMSCAGNRWLRTPAMDEIAANGIRFSHAYATNPVSVPSRFSLQTGRYPSEIGMVENGRIGVDPNKVIGIYSGAIGNVLKKGGYQTFYGGKVHMPVTGSDVNVLGYELLTLDERDSLAKVCADFLMHRQKDDKPFLLFASFINPHDICYHAIRWAEPESGLARSTPPELNEALELPEGIADEDFFREYCPPLPSNHQPMIGEPWSVDSLVRLRMFRQIVREKWTEKEWRMHRWAYMKLTERVDAQIGIVLKALKESGFSDNTVVIFTSDHGDLDAAHKLEHKTILYEEAARIPFIISYPWMKKKGIVDNEHLISNGLSLLPTLCDIAGIDPPDGIKGKSVLPLAERKNVSWTNCIFLETEAGNMIHTGRYKYELDNTSKNREMFVDLQTDPGETVNLIGRHEYRHLADSLRAVLLSRLDREGISYKYPSL